MSEEVVAEQAVETKPEKPGKKVKAKKVKEKKKGKGKVLVIVSLVILLLGGGGFAAAAFMGLIPGLKLGGKPVAKKAASTEADKPKEAAAAKAAPVKTPPARPNREAPVPEPEAPKKKAPQVTIDPEKGAKAIARIWEKMEPEKLAEIAATYKDLELARVLRGMETKKAAALLGLLPAERAGKLSQEMEKLASRTVETSGI